MIMADVFAVFGALLTIGIALPGLLLTWHLLLPAVVERTQQRLTHTPWVCFFSGGLVLGIYLIPTLILFNLPWRGFQALGFGAVLILVTIASFGAAGLAGLMGKRLQEFGFATSPIGATLRGAIALELAAIFPIIGWFIFIPLTFITVLGASFFALLGWRPREAQHVTKTAESIEGLTLLNRRLVTEE